jgi:hypothetical protein
VAADEVIELMLIAGATYVPAAPKRRRVGAGSQVDRPLGNAPVNATSSRQRSSHGRGYVITLSRDC